MSKGEEEGCHRIGRVKGDLSDTDSDDSVDKVVETVEV